MTPPTGPVVYRIHNQDGDLIYIGSTANLVARLKGHAGVAPWWLGDLTVTFDEYPDMTTAHQAEVYAILTEHPRWNIQWRCEAHPEGHANSWRDVARKYPFRETTYHQMSHRSDPNYRRRPYPCPLKAYPEPAADAIPGLTGIRFGSMSDPGEKVSA